MAQTIYLLLLLKVLSPDNKSTEESLEPIHNLTSEGLDISLKHSPCHKNAVQNASASNGIWSWRLKCSSPSPKIEVVLTQGTQLIEMNDLSRDELCIEKCGGSYKICKGKCKKNGRDCSCQSSADRKIHISANLTTVTITFDNITYHYHIINQTDPGPYVKFYSEQKSWIDALEFCKKSKSFLVEITNETVTNKTIEILLNETHLEEGVWVGLERSFFGTEWRWISGSDTGSIQWNDSIPDNHLKYHCGKVLVPGQRELKYLNECCHKKLPFICQRNFPFI
ncbi:uncharacterized protein LOC125013954 [Mugil cephalus]|uniref:uncharacterized protein LOC125013954 n=1 Tax=Mugil cephalus TaxID=48193 RepID=UPI001FB5B04C|nr:uncharacterized protein LOC125013954 [Mugil cephalus]